MQGMNEPVIIQGGMGAGVSNWRLAQAVSRLGQLGLVSGTALDQILARRLQDGDDGGHMRRGLDAFPDRAMADRIWQKYFIPGGRAERTPYLAVPPLTKDNPRDLIELCIVANFVEVYLAAQGHKNPVGINYLEKIQAAHLACIYGAMLAGVGYVVMGAGIPLKIPGVLDNFVNHLPADYAIHVVGAQEGDDVTMHFDPRQYLAADLPPLTRPKFLPIVSSNTLAVTMLKKANGRVDGLVIETRTAGGHNAPPRGKLQLSAAGEPIYGERDSIDIAKLRELGVPFWLAGGYGHPAKVQEALAQGAAGVQVGTAFEFANESGLRDEFKHQLLAGVIAGNAAVIRSPRRPAFPSRSRSSKTVVPTPRSTPRVPASATSDFCVNPTAPRTAQSAIAVPASRSVSMSPRAAMPRTLSDVSASVTDCSPTSALPRSAMGNASNQRWSQPEMTCPRSHSFFGLAAMSTPPRM
jgi:nitronate monooxygenase